MLRVNPTYSLGVFPTGIVEEIHRILPNFSTTWHILDRLSGFVALRSHDCTWCEEMRLALDWDARSLAFNDSQSVVASSVVLGKSYHLSEFAFNSLKNEGQRKRRK